MEEQILKIISSNATQIRSDSLSRALFADEWRESAKEIADTFKRFMEWAIINVAMPFGYGDACIEVESNTGFDSIDKLFQYWSEVIDKKVN